jgi:hypothetical protein
MTGEGLEAFRDEMEKQGNHSAKRSLKISVASPTTTDSFRPPTTSEPL